MIKIFVLGAIAGVSLFFLVLYFTLPIGILWFDYRESLNRPIVYAEFPKRVQSGNFKYVLLRSKKIMNVEGKEK